MFRLTSTRPGTLPQQYPISCVFKRPAIEATGSPIERARRPNSSELLPGSGSGSSRLS